MRVLSLFALLGMSLAALAESWQFDEPLLVSPRSENVFHHLESAGRRNIAVSDEQVAIIWEDDRDGTPRVYLARKALSDTAFAAPVRISGDGEAYEPGLVALGEGRFAAAWEEDGRVRLRVIGRHSLGPRLSLPEGESVQPSLLYANGELQLTVAQRDGRHNRIYLYRFEVDRNALLPKGSCAVDAEAAGADQLYPTLARQQGLTVVAWEDRRPGHTIIMAAQSQPDTSCGFSPPLRISLRPEGAVDMPFGRGHGVSRVALAAYGDEAILAVWEDKRDFREGYAIYAAHWHRDGGFGANQRVQDEFGSVARQWHPSVSGDAAGRLVVAWADERDGDANILFSIHDGHDWSEDYNLPGATGPGVQNHPSITLDAQGKLHAAWVERERADGPTRLKYVFGERQ